MNVQADPAWVTTVYLVAVRVGVLLLMSPVFASLGGLVTVRVLLTLMLSAVLVAGLDVQAVPVGLALGPVVVATLGEIAVGAVLAFGVFAAFGAFSLAGKLLDVQSGFGMGSVYDPVTRAGAPMFASLLNMLAVVCFFSMDAHHAFLRGIAFSLREVPPGAGFIALGLDAAIRQFGLVFSLGVALVIPVLLCLLLIEVGLAVISRVLPQMNVFIVLVPVKIVAAIGIFLLTLGLLAPAMGRVYASIFTFWEQVLA